MFIWGGLLALGLVLGYAASLWSQKPKNNAENIAVETQQKTAAVAVKTEVVAPEVSVNANNNVAKISALQPNVYKPPSSAQIAAPIQTEDILTARLNATAVWLASQAPTTVSIQLMGASSETQLKYDLEALSQQIELDNIYVYRTKVNNMPFLTVLYGNFPSRLEAIQALHKLPVEIQKNRPQLRTIAGVLQETK